MLHLPYLDVGGSDMTRSFTPFEGGSRVVSLWDMLELNASAFYAAVSNLRQAQGRIEEKKKLGKELKERLSNKDMARAPEILGRLHEALETLGAQVTAIAVQSLLHKLDNERDDGILVEEIGARLNDIDSRLRDELSLTTVLVIVSARQKYLYTSSAMFGHEVADKLPSAIPDIEDAGKCLACGQGTAAVFHSMRVMEASLKSFAMLLDIPYAPSWESYIKQIEAKINEKHKSKSIEWKRDEAFFRDILGNLQTIKISWRNPTMHIVRRYSEDEAEEIFIAVKSFVKRLAPRLPNPPNPHSSRVPLSGG